MVRVNLILHLRIDVNDARTDAVQSLLLPDLSSHQHLRVIQIYGLHYRDDAEGYPTQGAMITTEDYLWEQVAIMIKSAATNLRSILLHMNDNNVVFHPIEQRFMVGRWMKDGPCPGECLGRLDGFDWSSLGRTLLTCEKLVNVFILINPQYHHNPGGNPWALYRKTVDAIQSQLPAVLRRKLAFGAMGKKDVIYMYVDRFVCRECLSFSTYRSQMTSECSLPTAKFM